MCHLRIITAVFIGSSCSSFTVFLFLAGGARVVGQEVGAQLTTLYVAKKVSRVALTVPVGGFTSQLDFLDFDNCPCPGPFLSMMSSFVILDSETAKNSEQFNLKDRSAST